jgi:hypothetical protein
MAGLLHLMESQLQPPFFMIRSLLTKPNSYIRKKCADSLQLKTHTPVLLLKMNTDNVKMYITIARSR